MGKIILYYSFVMLLIIITLPIQMVIAISIAITSGFPIIFRQVRMGKNNRPFIIYKFRTMVVGSEEKKTNLSSLNEAQKPVFKIHDDPRFTPIGKFLSHTGLDELPQLFNVIKGEMSLISPRPLPLSEAEGLQPWQQKRHMIKPGIISPWIFSGYHTTTFDAWMKSDIAYARSKNAKEDVALFFKSITFCIHLLVNEIRSLLLGKKQQ